MIQSFNICNKKIFHLKQSLKEIHSFAPTFNLRRAHTDPNKRQGTSTSFLFVQSSQKRLLFKVSIACMSDALILIEQKMFRCWICTYSKMVFICNCNMYLHKRYTKTYSRKTFVLSTVYKTATLSCQSLCKELARKKI